MKRLVLFFLFIGILLLASCGSTVPKEYRSHACAEVCFPDGEVDVQFEEALDRVVAPECKVIPDYEPISPGMLRLSPTCDGEDTYCDCLLDDGSYLFESFFE